MADIEGRYMRASGQPQTPRPDSEKGNPPVDRSRTVTAYLLLLQLVLLGFAVGGRTFAGLGIGPLHVGELTLGASLGLTLYLALVHLRRCGWGGLSTGLRSLLRSTVALPLVFLALFQLWGALRTLPYLGIYGLDALRDGVVWGYAFFAWSTLVILAGEPRRFRELSERYRVFLVVFLCLIPIVTLLSWAFYDRLPTIGVTDRFLFELRAGEVLTHLAGITAYLALVAPGFPASAIVLVSLSAPLALFYGSLNRASLLGFALSLTTFLLHPVGPRRLAWVGVSLTGAFVLLWLSGIWFRAPFHPREVSARQLVSYLANPLHVQIPPEAMPRLPISGEAYFLRLVGLEKAGVSFASKQARLQPGMGMARQEGLKASTGADAPLRTVEFRLDWWKKVVGYTVLGPYRWLGKGYGVNLANDDGFQNEPGDSLRSPHNIQITILARSGVIGLALWVGLQASWLACLLAAIHQALLRGDLRSAGAILFLLTYWISFLIIASLGVFLEGPMAGIWFWVIFGAGLAAAHCVRDARPGGVLGELPAAVKS